MGQEQKQQQGVPYTPTPWHSPGHSIWGPGERGPKIAECNFTRHPGRIDTTEFPSMSEAEGNSRLTVASVNSYARHFPDNAVEAAEEDVLGQALKACQYNGTLDNSAYLLDRAVKGEIDDDERCDAIEHVKMLVDIAALLRIILAKAKGGAA